MVRLRLLQSAFTLVELLIGVTVIGVLAAVAIVNTTASRAAARDANRRASVEAYATALQQYRTLNNSYRVVLRSGVGTGLAANGVGKMTRRTAKTTRNSIADGLVEWGVLTSVRTDPLDTNIGFEDATNDHDFYLWLASDAKDYIVYANLERPGQEDCASIGATLQANQCAL